MATDDRIEGKWDEAKGNVKEKVGEIRGDQRQQAEGQLDQAKGKAKQGVADVKDVARDTGDRAREAVTR